MGIVCLVLFVGVPQVRNSAAHPVAVAALRIAWAAT